MSLQPADRHPGEPLNVAVVGTEEESIRAMVAAGWVSADPIMFHSSVRIAVDSVFAREIWRAIRVEGLVAMGGLEPPT